MRRPIRVTATIERHDPRLPRYVVVPRRLLARHGIRDRLTVRGELAGVAFQHRSLHPWDEERFFMNLPQRLCADAGVDTGDTVALWFEPQADEIPEELSDALSDAASRAAWASLSPGEQRRAAWQVAKAARKDTRRRRADRIAAELRSSADG